MVPVQEANSDNLGKSFRFSTKRMYVECTLSTKRMYVECTLILSWNCMLSTLNIQFHDKIRKKSLIILELLEEFCRDRKTSSNHPR